MAKTTKKILIADDEKPLARALELKLRKVNFEAESVFNGQDALDNLIKGGFDLLLLDLVMPKMNGFEVMEAMKNKKINIPVFVLSNLSQEEDEARALSLGAKAFFVKSGTPLAEIIEKVQKYLA